MRDLGLDCEWERTGALSVAVEDHQVEWLRDSTAPRQHFLDREQVRAEIDSPLFLAGGLEPDDHRPGPPGPAGARAGASAAATSGSRSTSTRP